MRQSIFSVAASLQIPRNIPSSILLRKPSMTGLGMVPFLILVLLPSLRVSLEASVQVQNAIVIPPYQSPPCNADHPNNCPKPINPPPSKPCNGANRCRIHSMFYEDGSGNRFLVDLIVEGGPADLTDLVLTEAVTSAISRWLVKKTKNNAAQELRISIDTIDGHSPTFAELRYAASWGTRQAASNFKVVFTPASDSAHTEKEASFDRFYANIMIKASHPGKPVMFEFSTIAKGLGEADLNDMMKPVPDVFRKLRLKATWMESEDEYMSHPKP
ncbi:uncharacterized protein LOC110425113 [Herrania umbratica]|uniref:Uncharacterized protein LOC110425113 n=1 Tax=Herrania umbratica TaxID=108875 RepID=A0A6J1B8F8_9ROSI|nr:uncharacterized protein LOC110425113 [Herrania umbratica]